ncbi:MAG: NAD(P)-dependent oxidoreductase [Desulfobacterales bacterium]|nr:MAG: NAD(P)-dependent oxidoreductase [Desulfobacterales bacterium]
MSNPSKILITGASGFIGRELIDHLFQDYYIYAFARRTQLEAGVAAHKHIEWILVDIAHESSLATICEDIKQKGGVDYIIHLAAYYDFDNEPYPEFERTNVTGTRLLLEEAKKLNPKQFILASSLAACNFPPPGNIINEQSPLDADYPYAVSKKKGEQMLKAYSEYFPCSSVRLAAVYSDWCEYGLLYILLNTWLSSSWRSRILPGKGESAIPYVHVNCVARLFLRILEKTERLPQFDIYIASPDGATSHQELFDMATRHYFGEIRHPIFLSKWICAIGVYVRDLLGRLVGRRPFERPWMIKYIDLKMPVESFYTRKALAWEPRPRYLIMRRLLFLLENLKNSPVQWHQKNTDALTKPSLDRPNLILAEIMQSMQEEITHRISVHLTSPDHIDQFKPYYDLQDPDKVKWYVETVYNLLIASVRNGDRYELINYARSLGKIRSREGFKAEEVCQALIITGKHISSALLVLSETKGMKLLIHDWITLSVQLAADEVEDSFERMARLKR